MSAVETSLISPAGEVEKPQRIESLVREWKSEEFAAETRLWNMARIASDVCGNYDGASVKQFARQVHYTRERIYELGRAFQLRMSMPEHREAVGEWRPGRYLSVSHFVHASYYEEPQQAVRRAVKSGLSSSQLEQQRKHGSLNRRGPGALGANSGGSDTSSGEGRESGPEILEAVELGENLRNLRLKRQVSQLTVARYAGLTRDELATFENGIETPTLRQLARLCGVYETTMDVIAGHMVPVPVRPKGESR